MLMPVIIETPSNNGDNIIDACDLSAGIIKFCVGRTVNGIVIVA
jgi:hypothetical protein